MEMAARRGMNLLPIFFWSVCVVLCAAKAMAAERPVIIVSTTQAGWPPYIEVADEPAGYRGVMIDVMREIAEGMGYSLRFETCPDRRNRKHLAEGKIDTFAKAREWLSNPEEYLWTDPLVDSADILVSSILSPFTYAEPRDIEGADIGVIHGFRYPTLDPIFDKGAATRHVGKRTRHLLEMVRRGRIDAAVVNELVAKWTIRTNDEVDKDDFVFSKIPVDSVPFRFAFRKNDGFEAFVARFNEELARMKRDGRYEAILSNYL